MISGVLIENFRSIERLDLQGLGRVNLLVGKNNTGKTSVLEAVWAAGSGTAGTWVNLLSHTRGSLDVRDYKRSWMPLFRNNDVDKGLTITVTRHDGKVGVHLAPAPTPPAITLPVTAPFAAISVPFPAWSMSVDVTRGDAKQNVVIHWNGAQLLLPQSHDLAAWLWIGTSSKIRAHDVGLFSQLIAEGKVPQLVELMKLADATIADIDLLAPTGTAAELWVRREGGPLLPLSTLGDGVIRILDFAIGLAIGDAVFIDEVENGIHHSVLTGLWTSFATLSRATKRQVFAATHSAECLTAACRAFVDAGDDGLRVIRLDNGKEGLGVSVYSAAQALAATDLDVEIRGT